MLIQFVELVKEHIPFFSCNKSFYCIPLIVYGLSILVHSMKLINHKTPHFTRLFCLFLGLSVLIEFLITLKYVLEAGHNVIDAINVQWLIVMLVGGFAQLLTPFGVNSAETFYVKKLTDDRF